jgi:hypothetical protein
MGIGYLYVLALGLVAWYGWDSMLFRYGKEGDKREGNVNVRKKSFNIFLTI